MKIAIIGTHGTGKSTLSYLMAAHYKKEGKNVKVVQEVARTCPFPINHWMTKEAALWIYLEHSRKELEAEHKHDVVVCDRSVYDSFAYAKYFGLIDAELESFEEAAFKHLYTYDKLIFIRPDMPIQTDGIRPTDKEFQQGVDEIIRKRIEPLNVTEIKSSEIFEEFNWTLLCL